MDSKFLKATLLISLLFMTTIFFVVLYTNGMGPGQKKTKPQVQEQPVEDTVLRGQIGNDLSGWMEDDSFFDDPAIFASVEDGAQKVSLLATSIEKDMRVRIVGSDGNPVKGQFFKITVNEEQEYLDLDRDGVIYVTDLQAGEYQVLLEPKDGYAVPQSVLPVKVKDRVEHREIPDISLLIKSEEEVDVMVEDTGNVLETTEEEEPTELRKDSQGKLGMSVSRWNEDISWNKVKDAGIEYALIRAGYRGSISGTLVEDKTFVKNMEGAKSAGIPVGIYFISQATTEVEAVEEASMVLSMCKKFEVTYPIFVDVSGADGNGRADHLSAKERTALSQAFCDTIQRSGFKAGIYGDKSCIMEKLDVGVLPDDIYICLAEYGDEISYEGGYHMWQYTSSGRVLGIEGRVNLNLSFMEP